MKLKAMKSMSIPLGRRSEKPWRVGSHTGEFLYDTEPLTSEQIIERNEEFTWASKKRRRHGLINGHLTYERMPDRGPVGSLLANKSALDWLTRMGNMSSPAVWDRISKSGAPVGVLGSYTGPGAFANASALAAVTGGTANVVWWTPLQYSPLPAANGLKFPSGYRLTAGGLITSSAASQTVTLSANCGTVVGTGLGTSSALTLGSTISNAFWRLAYDYMARSGTTAGAAVGEGLFHWGTTAGASSTVSNALFGGGNVVQTVDFVTTQQALAIGATPSATGVSVTPTIVQWASWD